MATGAATNGSADRAPRSSCASPPRGRSTTARTLIGRLLYDTKSIFEDQLEHVERTSLQRATAT